MTTDLMLQRICLRPVSQEMARETVEGQRHDDWAPDYPTDGDVFISSVVLRAIDAGVAYRPPSLALPWTGPWQICVRGEAGETVVGGIGFKGGPVDGTVEIGYGIAEKIGRAHV